MEEQKEQTVKQRPTFLTVLCILTFIGSGLGILFSLLAIFGIGATSSFIANYGGVEATDSGIIKPILTLVFSAASIYGAIMMWNLKRMGFYLYVAAQVLIVAFGWSILALVFALLFIILYGLNLKHLE